MKTRIALGLLASFAVLLAASTDAEAATKKRGSKGSTKAAALVVDAPVAPSTSGKKAAKAKAKKKGSAKAKKSAGVTVPASLSSVAAAAPASSAVASGAEREHDAASAAAKAPAAPAKASRFLASGVPLVEVSDGRLAAVGTKRLPCGTRSRWAKVKSRWNALDAWGRITGTLTVDGSDRYDGSGCHQVRFSEGTGRDGLGVFVAAGSGYTPGPTAEWKPEGDVAKRFESLYAAQVNAWVEGKADKAAAPEKRSTLFFELPKQQGSVEGAPTQRRPTRWAVTGGRVLLVGYVSANGAWKVGHVLPPTGKDHAYEPLAIFDMNGDGLPEIVVHEESAGVYVDRVLSFDAGTMRWENAVASPGGATR